MPRVIWFIQEFWVSLSADSETLEVALVHRSGASALTRNLCCENAAALRHARKHGTFRVNWQEEPSSCRMRGAGARRHRRNLDASANANPARTLR